MWSHWWGKKLKWHRSTQTPGAQLDGFRKSEKMEEPVGGWLWAACCNLFMSSWAQSAGAVEVFPIRPGNTLWRTSELPLQPAAVITCTSSEVDYMNRRSDCSTESFVFLGVFWFYGVFSVQTERNVNSKPRQTDNISEIPRKQTADSVCVFIR